MADRDREAAVDLASEFFVDFGPNDERWHDLFKDRMSAIVAKARAEGAASERAAATAACADLVQERKHRAQGARILAEQDDCFDFVVEKIVAEIRQWQSVEDEIRALSPEGWCAVRRDDLDVLYQAALVSDHVADDRMDRIRAALARGKGE